MAGSHPPGPDLRSAAARLRLLFRGTLRRGRFRSIRKLTRSCSPDWTRRSADTQHREQPGGQLVAGWPAEEALPRIRHVRERLEQESRHQGAAALQRLPDGRWNPRRASAIFRRPSASVEKARPIVENPATRPTIGPSSKCPMPSCEGSRRTRRRPASISRGPSRCAAPGSATRIGAIPICAANTPRSSPSSAASPKPKKKRKPATTPCARSTARAP